MFPASPTGFMLLGTTVGFVSPIVTYRKNATGLTSRVDPDDSNVEPTELRRQQPDEMVGCSFTCGIAGQVHVRCIVQTGARTRHNNGTTTTLPSQMSIAQIELRSCGQQWQQCHRQEVMSSRVYTKRIGPVRMPRRPHGCLQLGQWS